MSKTVTLRIDDSSYRLFKALSERENRPLSNYIETAVKRYIEANENVDEFEMAEIKSNVALGRSLKRGTRYAKARRGRFVCVPHLRNRRIPEDAQADRRFGAVA